MVVKIEHLKTPFFVSVLKHPSEDVIIEEYFADPGSAQSFYEREKVAANTFAYLGEIGLFSNDNNELASDYIVFDTNNLPWWKETSYSSQVGLRGYGRPWSKTYAVKYQPVADSGSTNWRL